MLTELIIHDFAIIDNLRMSIAPGFTVLTGETGAGKSIILDAVTLVLGGRADSSMVRSEADRAIVEGLFFLSPELKETIIPILQREGLEEEEESDILNLAREIRTNGRSISRINGRSVSLALMRQIATPLLDIHGQGEHLSLLQPQAHLPLLDSYGSLNEQREAFSIEVDRLQKVKRELDALQRDERMLAQRVDMLQYQISEIGAAGLIDGEDSELLAERSRLANAEQLNRFATEIEAALIGVDDEGVAATDLLGTAERALSHLARLDETKAPLLGDLQGLAYQLNELAANIQSYQNTLEFNPRRLNDVEERLELINTLKRKYGDSIAAILATIARASDELERISHNEEHAEELQKEQERLLRRIGEMGDSLSSKRREAASKLSEAVEKELNDLQMEGARFEVQFGRDVNEKGAYVGDIRVAFDRTGLDKVEFVLSANPGEPLKPVAKVASGGETARLMLAIKTALAQVDHTPTLIFDEIDQGIGGRVGAVVGQKLWGLTSTGNHQVVVVTHLPQLAGYGDVHFHVSKQVQDGRTRTIVKSLNSGDRIAELADMLGTKGDSAVGGARSILQQVQYDKGKITPA